MKHKHLIPLGVAVLLAITVAAQEKSSGILHPEMAVAAGSWEHPAATIGVKPDRPWSATTVNAGVDHKPEPGHIVTRVGEIIDVSCYLELGKHGKAHAPCAQDCVRNGQPIGLLTRDGAVYLLMPEEHDPRRAGTMSAKPVAIQYMAQIVEVNGTEAMHNGYRALYVRDLTNK